MRYWVSAIGFGRDGTPWETKPVPVELGIAITMSEDSIEDGGLVFEDDEFICEPIPTVGLMTGLLLRTEPDVEPFEFIPLSTKWEIRAVAEHEPD